MTRKNPGSAPQKPAADVLISGSAGFIGRHLLRRLSEKNRASISLYHARLPEPMAHALPVFGDLLRVEHLSPALDGIETVVHLAWNQSFRTRIEDALWGAEETMMASRNLEMLRNLIQAMQEVGTRRIIFVSALGASRTTESLYLQEKYQAELMILNSKIPEKIILRSALTFGDIRYKDRLVTAIERLMRFPWFYPVPKSREKLAPLHVQDLSEILLRLIDQALPEQAQILEVTGQQELALEEVFRIISQGIGKGTHIPLKGFLGEALTPLFERLRRDTTPVGPHIRDLLTIGNRRDTATTINSPLQQTLPTGEHRFQDAMQQHEQPLLQ
ncbi:MAG TPA: NAD(P)H-binding protein [Oligoflexus sp.]|uniref:SDR family oxidoreductase n=1 Tax=Oligoflexus sp. TaxID=1971216 RepID=UPI002D2826B1|nr:NAD(P)H-binding protein [Oligoflexus sp.]HYX35034.1 NAD(P)H-binding protein [Oligoflexus sp.]